MPELSPRKKRNRRKLYLQFAESMGQFWLAEWKSLTILSLFDLSGDFLTQWNAITVRKGREKGQLWDISYFWIEVFLKKVLGLLPYEGTAFIPNLSS